MSARASSSSSTIRISAVTLLLQLPTPNALQPPFPFFAELPPQRAVPRRNPYRPNCIGGRAPAERDVSPPCVRGAPIQGSPRTLVSDSAIWASLDLPQLVDETITPAA